MLSPKRYPFCSGLNVLNKCCTCYVPISTQRFHLQWCQNECDGISNHHPHDCLLKLLFKRRSKKTSKLHVTGLCDGNSPVTREFPAQRASNTENVSIWWRHHALTWRLWSWRLGWWRGGFSRRRCRWWWGGWSRGGLPGWRVRRGWRERGGLPRWGVRGAWGWRGCGGCRRGHFYDYRWYGCGWLRGGWRTWRVRQQRHLVRETETRLKPKEKHIRKI